MRPLVGIPLGLDESGRWNAERETHYIDTAYARAVEAAGGVPVHLPMQGEAPDLVRRLDGLLIPGGDDFLPDRSYPDAVRFQPTPPRQIEFDRRLLTETLGRRRPVLAICYGMQLLALHHGGRLHYDVPTDVPGALEHRLPEADARHALRIAAGSRLADALGTATGPVNSRHHQAVRDPGNGLRVSARAEDGIIEAIEAAGGDFCVGVQWHPEKMEGAHRDALFAAFVAECRSV